MRPVAGRRRRSRAARREETLDRLLVATAELTRQGEVTFSDLPVERLATAAGISRATFYIYFEDKAVLVRSWFAALNAQLFEIAQGWCGGDAPETRAAVRTALVEMLDIYRQNRTVLAALQDMLPFDPELRDRVEEARLGLVNLLDEHIRRGQAAGWVDSDLLAHETALWVVSMLDRTATAVYAHLTAPDPALVDAAAGMVWRTLYVRTAA